MLLVVVVVVVVVAAAAVVVVVLTLTRTIKPAVTGQAPLNREWNPLITLLRRPPKRDTFNIVKKERILGRRESSQY